MKTVTALAVLISCALCTSIDAQSQSSEKSHEPPQAQNEQILKGYIGLHDPAGIVNVDEYLMTFATGRTIRTAYLPPDSDEWMEGDPVFTREERPEWIEEHVPGARGYWAPHAPFPRVIYYSSANDLEGKDIAAIGRATAIGDPPYLTWIDDGKPVLVCDRSSDDEPFAIDPAVFKGENDTLWLVYGSHWTGIWVVELDPENGHIKDKRAREEGWSADNPAFQHVASELGAHNPGTPEEEHFVAGAIEAPYTFWNGEYYYLFVNWGICCHGVDSTYEIRIGRSKSATGPYLDKDGHDMAEGGGTLFLKRDGRFIGPGHANISVFEGDDNEKRYIFTYHYYDGEEEGRPKMHARELIWGEDGWPVLTDNVFYQLD